MPDEYDADGYGIDIKPSMYGVRDPLGTPVTVAAEVDTVGPWLVTVDGPHHEVHEGESFHVEHRADNIASGTSADVLLTVPAGKYLHSTFTLSGTAECDVYWYKSPTATGGTALTVNNRVLSSTKVSSMTAKHTPTVSAVGTLMESEHIGNNQSKIGGDRRSNQEWVLTEGTYLLRVTSRAAGNYLRIAADFYEEGAA